MRTSSQSIIIASLVLPLLLVGCNRSEKTPATTGSSQESQAMKPPPQPAAPAMEKAPVDQKSETKKEN